MSVMGIMASGLLNELTQNFENTQNTGQNFQQEFQQLGEDLQSGNLSAAESDLAILQPSASQSESTSTSQNSNPIAQEFNELSQALQAGNLTEAQQDYSTIQQDFQNQTQSQSAQGHHHHYHGSGSGTGGVSQLLQQLGSALQSGNLSSAQQAYSALDQAMLPFTEGSGQSSASASSQASTLSVSA